MADLFKKIKGVVGSVFQLGKGEGILFKSTGTDNGEVRNSTDTGYARLKVLAGTNDNDAVNLKQLNTASKPTIVSDQADTSVSIPSNTGVKRTLVVTTAGSGASIGDLLYDDGSGVGTMEILTAVEGQTIAVTDALTGGSISFDPDSIYIWDADNTQWTKIGDIGAVTGAVRMVRFAIDNTASQESTFEIPANDIVESVHLEVTTAYSPGATIEIGKTGSTDALMASTDNNPQLSSSAYECEERVDFGPSDGILVTVGGAPAAGAGIVTVRFANPNS